MAAPEKQLKLVLVVGGSGYLGQHLLSALVADKGFSVAFTHKSDPPRKLLDAFPSLLPFRADVATGLGFDAIIPRFGQPDVIVNCAAISVPRACEVDPHAAMATNVPSSLVRWLSSFQSKRPILIHLSTDQVYQGVKSFYKEEDDTVPVNMYGKSKVAAEQYIAVNCSNYAILRSSIIYGPHTVSPVPKSLPLQWIDSSLSEGQEVGFFNDEFRCPVYVKDMVSVIILLANRWISDCKPMQLLLNVGGPDRVSRLQMAEYVAKFRGHPTSLIKSISASSVDRGVASPADISMDVTKLIEELNFQPTTFQDGVRATFLAE